METILKFSWVQDRRRNERASRFKTYLGLHSTACLLPQVHDSHILSSTVEKDLRRIVKPVMDAQPDAPSAIIADIVLIEHRGLLHAWLVGQIEGERKHQTAPSSHRRGRKLPDPRQDWLDLPEFKDIRSQVQGDTMAGLQERIDALQEKLKRYSYVRLSLEKEKADKRELRAMLRLKAALVPFFVNDPSMTVGEALELYKKEQETERAKRQRKAAKSRWGRNR